MANCGSEVRAGKRSREESITDKFFSEVCMEAREFFETESESSVQKKTGTKHIIYYEPFVNYDMVIRNIPTGIPTELRPLFPGCLLSDPSEMIETTDALQPSLQRNFVFEIRIKRVDWARAFNQLDFLPTIKFLYVALLTEECRRVTDHDLTARGNIHDIMRKTAAWMMSKFGEESHIDPWSFPLEYSKIMDNIPEPDDTDGATIDGILANLNPNECLRPVAQQTPRTLTNYGTNYWTTKNYSTAALVKQEKKKKEDKQFDDWFRSCVEHVSKSSNVPMNMAQIVAAATRSTLLSNSDQFVDGVQFSVEKDNRVSARWGTAFDEGRGLDYPEKIGKIAARLCSTILRLDFGKNLDGFQSVEDIHQPKLLAIYRGAKFLYERRSIPDGDKEEFDSRIESHNVFPTKKECLIINEEIRLHGVATVLGRLKIKDKKPYNQVVENVNNSPVDLDLSMDLMVSDILIDDPNIGISVVENTAANSSQDITRVATSSLNVPIDVGFRHDPGEFSGNETPSQVFTYQSNLEIPRDESVNDNPVDLDVNMDHMASHVLIDNPNIRISNNEITASNTSQDVVPVTKSSSNVPIEVQFRPDLVLSSGENPGQVIVYQPDLGINRSNEHICIPSSSQTVHFGNPENFLIEEISLAQLKLKKAEMKGIEPKLLLDGCTEEDAVVLTVGIEKKGSDGTYRVADTREYAYSRSTWAKAQEIYGTAGPVEMGTSYLLKQLFHKDELKNFTPSGRVKKKDDSQEGAASTTEPKKCLDKGRQEQLLDTIRYFMWKFGLPQFEIYHLVEKALTTDIIHVGTKVIRKRLQKDQPYYDSFTWE